MKPFGIRRASIRMTDLLRNLLLVIVFVSISVSGFLVSRLSTNYLKERIVEGNSRLANSIAHEIDQLLAGYRRTLSLLGEGALRNREFLDAMAKTHDGFEEIVFLDRAGRVQTCSGSSLFRGYDMSRRTFFTEPTRTGRWYVSPSSVSTRTYNPTVALAQPFDDGVAVGFLNLASLAEYVQGISLGEGDLVAVVDSQGYYIAHSVPGKVVRRESVGSEALDGDLFTTDARTLGGISDSLVSSAPVPAGGWNVVVARSSEQLRKPIEQTTGIVLATLLATALATTLTIMAVLRRVARDIEALSSHTSTIASGDYEKLFEYSGYSDLKKLAENFTRMTEAIRGRERNLRINERDLKTSLAEKEVLIKEIHHRVKNNLQLIISLLSLQSSGTDEREESHVFDDSINRVRSMAIIHEMLYQSDNLSRISLAEYVRTIAETLVYSYSLEGKTVELIFEIADLYLDIDIAIPCGLIVNEILTNALKYAFVPDNPTLRILVRVRDLHAGTVSLVIEDDGAGLPPGLDPGTATSLGLKLITSLVSQIRGDWVISGPPGTRWTIVFPLKDS